jgi:hypothetical protein
MLLLAIATIQSLVIKSSDVYGAFFYLTQNEEIHIPPSIVTQLRENDVYWRLNINVWVTVISKSFYEYASA